MNDDNVVDVQVVSPEEANAALQVWESCAGHLAELEKLDRRIKSLRDKREALLRSLGKNVKDRLAGMSLPQTEEPDDFEDTDPDGDHA